MTPTASGSNRAAAGRRLAADMRELRNEKGVSLKDVVDALRLAEDVVKELEETALFDNPMFNRVYLRSLYASYADVLGVRREGMLKALEEALAGTYVDSLHKWIHVSTVEDVETEPDSPSEDVSADTDKDDHEAPVVASTSTPEVPVTTLGLTHPPGMAPRGVLLHNTKGLTTAVLSAVFLIGLVIFAIMWVLSDSSEDMDADPADSAQSILEAPAEIKPDPIVLPDTMTLFVTARDEQLDPVRVAVDDDIRRPYWVELDSTISFRFVDMIVIDREAGNAAYSLDGYVVPDNWLSSDGVFAVERESAQAWFDSLTDAGIFPDRNR